jgi:hypothetical protein
LLSIDHIRFRSCCHYLNDQSHQRHDIGTRSRISILPGKAAINFERIASSLHPYHIYYSLRPTHKSASNHIWKQLTSLRRLTLEGEYDGSYILSTLTSLTWLRIDSFSPQIRCCTNLLDLAIPLRSLSDYRYLPSSLTCLNLQLVDAQWSFDDESIMGMHNHLLDLSSLELDIGYATKFLKKGALSSLSQLSSLTKLRVISRGLGELSLDGFVHVGTVLSTPSQLARIHSCILKLIMAKSIGIKNFTVHAYSTKSLAPSIPISFPSLTHLDLAMYDGICTPTTMSHLMSLKSLTDLHLTVHYCVDLKEALITLQPLALILTKLLVWCKERTSACASYNHNNDYQMLSYLLPFRSLTELSILTSGSTLAFDITGSFIGHHWPNLANRSIQLSVIHVVRFLREFMSLTTSAPLPPLPPSNTMDTSSPNTENDNDSFFGLKVKNMSHHHLGEFLEDMEAHSLLIQSSKLSSEPFRISTPMNVRRPTISLECMIRFGEGNEQIQSLERDMNILVKSRNYINMLSFIFTPY